MRFGGTCAVASNRRNGQRAAAVRTQNDTQNDKQKTHKANKQREDKETAAPTSTSTIKRNIVYKREIDVLATSLPRAPPKIIWRRVDAKWPRRREHATMSVMCVAPHPPLAKRPFKQNIIVTY